MSADSKHVSLFGCLRYYDTGTHDLSLYLGIGTIEAGAYLTTEAVAYVTIEVGALAVTALLRALIEPEWGLFRLYTGSIQALFRLYSGFIHALFTLYSSSIQALSRLHSGSIQALFRLFKALRHY